jgi:uncharacterized protein
LWCVALLFFAGRAFALPVPPLEGRVNDRAQLLSRDVEQKINERLIAYEKATGHQLAVLTIPTLDGDQIEDFSIRVVEAWQLGKKGKDDGILILVVAKDRKTRIEVGYGLEGELPDANAGRIVRDVMAPRFRNGDFEGGITAAVDAVISKTGGSAAALSSTSDRSRISQPARPLSLLGRIVAGLAKLAFFGIFGFVFLFILLINRLGGPRSGGMFFGGGGYGGGTGGGFGGGGFSGGGGGFGGGGASGSW